jgi:MarR family transcriptional regulator, 2-MHQ and catechol-resistance regulon repressor
MTWDYMSNALRSDPATRLALGSFVKLRRAVNSLAARLNPPLARDHGLTESQFGVLEALLHLGPMPQARLCEKLLVSGSNLTTVIDNLERSGLVRRDPNPQDRRAYLVRLSNKGRALVARAFPGHAARVRELLGALTQAEQRELSRLCRKLGLAVRDGG